MNTYEAMMIFSNVLKDNDLDAAMTRAQEEIERNGGKVQHVKVVGKRTFARIMNKKESGVYVWMAFDAAPESIVSLNKRFKLNDDLFRVQILKADENTLTKYAPKPEAKAEDDAPKDKVVAQA
ncbi:MAG: 30S ribosomal protein S6 [Kiritimatiellae bacterium]|nr:30S ribosomal protein S6 [Kiritimatiellia bacterium]